MAEDYYSILQVNGNASGEEIKKAYRRLARKFHPDAAHSHEDKERFHLIQAAYDTLSDPHLRSEYDKKQKNKEKVEVYRKNEFTFERAKTRTSVQSKSDQATNEKLGKMFKAYQERRTERENQKRTLGEENSSVLDKLKSSVVNSIKKTSSFLRPGIEDKPNLGTGTRPAGRENIFHFKLDALESLSETHREIALPGGDTPRMIRVKVPAGIRDGAVLKVHCPASGKHPAREIEVRIQVEPHPLVERIGDDVTISLPITVYEAMTGATITSPTPDGNRDIRVPQPWSSAAKVRLEGLGLALGDGKGRGDLYIRTHIVLPEATNEVCMNAARVLEEFHTGPVRRNIPQFFSKKPKS